MDDNQLIVHLDTWAKSCTGWIQDDTTIRATVW